MDTKKLTNYVLSFCSRDCPIDVAPVNRELLIAKGPKIEQLILNSETMTRPLDFSAHTSEVVKMCLNLFHRYAIHALGLVAQGDNTVVFKNDLEHCGVFRDHIFFLDCVDFLAYLEQYEDLKRLLTAYFDPENFPNRLSLDNDSIERLVQSSHIPIRIRIGVWSRLAVPGVITPPVLDDIDEKSGDYPLDESERAVVWLNANMTEYDGYQVRALSRIESWRASSTTCCECECVQSFASIPCGGVEESNPPSSSSKNTSNIVCEIQIKTGCEYSTGQCTSGGDVCSECEPGECEGVTLVAHSSAPHFLCDVKIVALSFNKPPQVVAVANEYFITIQCGQAVRDTEILFLVKQVACPSPIFNKRS